MQAIQKEPLVFRGKDYTLELTTCNIDDNEQMSYTTYGIRVTDQDDFVRLQYQDVSTQRTFVEEFIRLCADNDVELVHVADILEDYLE